MKSKKLISFLCAAAMTVSSFAGLTINASAATDVFTYTDGSTTGWAAPPTSFFVDNKGNPYTEPGKTQKADDNDANDKYFLADAGTAGGERVTIYALPSAAQLTDDYVIEFDSYIQGSNGMGRESQTTQVVFYGENYAKDTRTYSDNNTGEGVGKGIILKYDTRRSYEAEGIIVNDLADTVPSDWKTESNYVPGVQNQWTRTQAVVSGGKVTINMIDANGNTLIDNVQYDYDGTKLAGIAIGCGRGDSAYGGGKVSLDNVHIYSGAAETLSTTGIKGAKSYVTVPADSDTKKRIDSQDANLLGEDNFNSVATQGTGGRIIGSTKGTDSEFTELNVINLAIPSNADERSSTDFWQLKVNSESDPTAGTDKLITAHNGEGSTANRGPRFYFKRDGELLTVAEREYVIAEFATRLHAGASAPAEVIFSGDLVASESKGNLASPLALITTDATAASAVYANDNALEKNGSHVLQVNDNEWVFVTITAYRSEGKTTGAKIAVTRNYGTDEASTTYIFGEAGTSTSGYADIKDSTKGGVNNLPYITFRSGNSDDFGTSNSSNDIDNIKVFSTTVDPTATPKPTPVPEHVVTIANDGKVSTTETTAFDAVLIHAKYTDGKLTSVKSYDIKNLKSGADFTPTLTDTIENGDKLMVWNSVGGMVPYGVTTVSGLTPAKTNVTATVSAAYAADTGLTATVNATPAAAATAFTYEWQKADTQDGTYAVVAGQTGATITDPAPGWYKVTASIPAGNATYNTVTATSTTAVEVPAPVVVKTAVNTVAEVAISGNTTAGSTLTATVTAKAGQTFTDTSAFTYAWTKDGNAVSGATAATLANAEAGVYTVTATYNGTGNYEGSITSAAVTVTAAGDTRTNLSTAAVALDKTTAKAGDTVTATVTIDSSAITEADVTYQWYKQNGADWTAVQGATAKTYTTTEAGTFKVTVSAKNDSELYVGSKDSANIVVSEPTAPYVTAADGKVKAISLNSTDADKTYAQLRDAGTYGENVLKINKADTEVTVVAVDVSDYVANAATNKVYFSYVVTKGGSYNDKIGSAKLAAPDDFAALTYTEFGKLSRTSAIGPSDDTWSSKEVDVTFTREIQDDIKALGENDDKVLYYAIYVGNGRQQTIDPDGFAITTKALHNVTISNSITGGTVTADKSTAVAGETVTLTVEPNSGNELKADSLKVNDGAVEVTTSGFKYTFTMPDADATVTAEFAAESVASYAVKLTGVPGYAQVYTSDTEGTFGTTPTARTDYLGRIVQIGDGTTAPSAIDATDTLVARQKNETTLYYKITKDGYTDKTGSVTMDGKDATIDGSMTPTTNGVLYSENGDWNTTDGASTMGGGKSRGASSRIRWQDSGAVVTLNTDALSADVYALDFTISGWGTWKGSESAPSSTTYTFKDAANKELATITFTGITSDRDNWGKASKVVITAGNSSQTILPSGTDKVFAAAKAIKLTVDKTNETVALKYGDDTVTGSVDGAGMIKSIAMGGNNLQMVTNLITVSTADSLTPAPKTITYTADAAWTVKKGADALATGSALAANDEITIAAASDAKKVKSVTTVPADVFAVADGVATYTVPANPVNVKITAVELEDAEVETQKTDVTAATAEITKDGTTLTASVKDVNPEAAAEAFTAYAWTRSATENGEYTPVAGALGKTLTAEKGYFYKVAISIPESNETYNTYTATSAAVEVPADPVAQATTATIAAVAADKSMYGKTLADLTDSFTITDTDKAYTATGTLKYVTGYTGFSSNTDEQSGNYLPFVVNVDGYNEASTIKIKGNAEGSEEQVYNYADYTDGFFVFILGGQSTALTIKVDRDGEGTAYTEETYTLSWEKANAAGDADKLYFTPAPTPITAVAIEGTTTIGETLTAKTTPEDATATYVWSRADASDGTYAPIEGATSKTYKLTADDAKKYIKVTATAGEGYTGEVTSEASAQIAEALLALTDGEEVHFTSATLQGKLTSDNKNIERISEDDNYNYITSYKMQMYPHNGSKYRLSIEEIKTNNGDTIGSVTYPKGDYTIKSGGSGSFNTSNGVSTPKSDVFVVKAEENGVIEVAFKHGSDGGKDPRKMVIKQGTSDITQAPVRGGYDTNYVQVNVVKDELIYIYPTISSLSLYGVKFTADENVTAASFKKIGAELASITADDANITGIKLTKDGTDYTIIADNKAPRDNSDKSKKIYDFALPEAGTYTIVPTFADNFGAAADSATTIVADGTKLEYTATVKSAAVTSDKPDAAAVSGAASVDANSETTYTVSLTSSGNPSSYSDVTTAWKVYTTYTDETKTEATKSSIDANGKLTVGLDETATTLYVVATVTDNAESDKFTELSATKEVTVNAQYVEQTFTFARQDDGTTAINGYAEATATETPNTGWTLSALTYVTTEKTSGKVENGSVKLALNPNKQYKIALYTDDTKATKIYETTYAFAGKDEPKSTAVSVPAAATPSNLPTGVTLSSAGAVAGDTVTITVPADADKQVDSVEVYTAEDETVDANKITATVDANDATKYTFTMPAGGIDHVKVNTTDLYQVTLTNTAGATVKKGDDNFTTSKVPANTALTISGEAETGYTRTIAITKDADNSDVKADVYNSTTGVVTVPEYAITITITDTLNTYTAAVANVAADANYTVELYVGTSETAENADATVNHGTKVTYKVTPAENYEVTSVTFNGTTYTGTEDGEDTKALPTADAEDGSLSFTIDSVTANVSAPTVEVAEKASPVTTKWTAFANTDADKYTIAAEKEGDDVVTTLTIKNGNKANFTYDLAAELAKVPEAWNAGELTVTYELALPEGFAIPNNWFVDLSTANTNVQGWGGGDTNLFGRTHGYNNWNTLHFVGGSASTADNANTGVITADLKTTKQDGKYYTYTNKVDLKNGKIFAGSTSAETNAPLHSTLMTKTTQTFVPKKLYLNFGVDQEVTADTSVKVKNVTVSYSETPTEYTIAKSNDEATYTIDKTKANAGDTVTVTATSGNTITDITVAGAPDAAIAENGLTATFTMPAQNVTVNVTETPVVTNYTITNSNAEADDKGNKLTIDKEEAEAKTAVVITPTIAEGYQLKSLTVKQGDTVKYALTASEGITALTPSADNTTYTFQMPAGNVSVSAEFEVKPRVNYATYLVGAKGAPVTFATDDEKAIFTSGGGSNSTSYAEAAGDEPSYVDLKSTGNSYYYYNSSLFDAITGIIGINFDYKPISAGIVINIDDGSGAWNGWKNYTTIASLTETALLYQGESVASLTKDKWNTIDIKADLELGTITFTVGEGEAVTKPLIGFSGVKYQSNSIVAPATFKRIEFNHYDGKAGEGYLTNLTIGTVARTEALPETKTLTVAKNGSIGDAYIGEKETTTKTGAYLSQVTATAVGSDTVRFDGWTSNIADGTLSTETTITRRLYADETLTANFTQLYAVALTYKVNDTAVEGLDVTIGEDKKKTDANGLVTFYLENGSYTATTAASAGNYLESSTNLTVSDEGITQDVTLTADATKIADLKFATGVEGAKIVITNPDSETTTLFTDASGDATFTSLPCDTKTYTYAITMLGYANKNGSVDLAASDADTTKTETVTMDKNAGVLFVDNFDSTGDMKSVWSSDLTSGAARLKFTKIYGYENNALQTISEPGTADKTAGTYAFLGLYVHDESTTNGGKSVGQCAANAALNLTTETDGFVIEYDQTVANGFNANNNYDEFSFADANGNVIIGIKTTQVTGKKANTDAFTGGTQGTANNYSANITVADNITNLHTDSKDNFYKNEWMHVKIVADITNKTAKVTLTKADGTSIANNVSVALPSDAAKSIKSIHIVQPKSPAFKYGPGGLRFDNIIISEYTAE